MNKSIGDIVTGTSDFIRKTLALDFSPLLNHSLVTGSIFYAYLVFANLLRSFGDYGRGTIHNIQNSANDMFEICFVTSICIVGILIVWIFFSRKKTKELGQNRKFKVGSIVLSIVLNVIGHAMIIFALIEFSRETEMIAIAPGAILVCIQFNKLRKLLVVYVMTFRNASPADIVQLDFIRKSVRENTLSDPNLITPADYEEFLFHRGKGWVCEIDNHIVGFAIADLQEENIWALFVHPDFEGRGIARALQKEMLNWYFTQKEKVWLGTAPGTRAEKFYRTSGWKENGMHGKEVKFEMTKHDWLSQR